MRANVFTSFVGGNWWGLHVNLSHDERRVGCQTRDLSIASPTPWLL